MEVIVSKAARFTLMSQLAWRSRCVMDTHATTRGLIPVKDGVKTELHVLHKGQ